MWIEWRLQELMAAEGMSPPALWELMNELAGIELPFRRVESLVNDRQPARIALSELLWLCEIFRCKIDDLLALRDGPYPWGPPSPLRVVPDLD
ncbi:helix-turn-helix domain-containing protein [Nocardioides sp. LML1-1-1.1]|uniref:helix-turn-helix domain-containing protein n=1 Tax=Nocardioides sp. LML1-1-1.1 TaxID=3135248 RepID=UPI0034260E48